MNYVDFFMAANFSINFLIYISYTLMYFNYVGYYFVPTPPNNAMRQNIQKCLAVNHKNIPVQKSLHYFLRIKKVLQNIFPLLNASK